MKFKNDLIFFKSWFYNCFLFLIWYLLFVNFITFKNVVPKKNQSIDSEVWHFVQSACTWTTLPNFRQKEIKNNSQIKFTFQREIACWKKQQVLLRIIIKVKFKKLILINRFRLFEHRTKEIEVIVKEDERRYFQNGIIVQKQTKKISKIKKENHKLNADDKLTGVADERQANPNIALLD